MGFLSPSALFEHVRSELLPKEKILIDQLLHNAPEKIDAVFASHKGKRIDGLVQMIKALLKQEYPIALTIHGPRNDPAEYLP